MSDPITLTTTGGAPFEPGNVVAVSGSGGRNDGVFLVTGVQAGAAVE